MKYMLLLLFSFSSLYAQQFVVNISGIPNDSSGSQVYYDPEGLVDYSGGNRVDPGIRIPDTTRAGVDPGIIGKQFPMQPKISVTVFVLDKDNDGKNTLRRGTPDEMLKYSRINSKHRIPNRNGYFIFVKDRWTPYTLP